MPISKVPKILGQCACPQILNVMNLSHYLWVAAVYKYLGTGATSATGRHVAAHRVAGVR
jgi:hypothetical protein